MITRRQVIGGLAGIIAASRAPYARCNWAMDFDEEFARAVENQEGDSLTFTFTDTVPDSLTIGAGIGAYPGPANPELAEYCSDGETWNTYSSKTFQITNGANSIKFRGDWRAPNRAYQSLFRNMFKATHPVVLTGKLKGGSPVNNMFWSTFSGCSGLTGSIPEGLFGHIEGAPATYMFNATFNGCSGLTGSIPVGLFGQLTGAPAAYMFNYTFNGCSGLTGSIPVGLFGQLTGAPAVNMFYYTFNGCSGLTGDSALMPDGVTKLYEMFSSAESGQVGRCYQNCTGLSDYAEIPAAWK